MNKRDQKSQDISTFFIKFDFFDHLNWSNLINLKQKEIKKDQNQIKIMIDDTIFVVRFESDQNGRSNLDGLESELSMIRCARPNTLF